MPRLMCDSTTLADIPGWADIPATYANGGYAVPVSHVVRAFPGRPLVRFNVNGDPKWGNVLDVERFDASPADAPRWFDGRVAAGLDPHHLGVYVNRSNIHAVHSVMGGRPWRRILSTLDGTIVTVYEGIHLDAVQAFGQKALAGAHYDLSVVFSDGWAPNPFAAAR